MKTNHYEQKTVEDIIEHVPGANHVLRPYGIDPTVRLSLANAAAATSTETDEMLAVLHYQVRKTQLH